MSKIKKKAVVFDLDGTLIDSVNHGLRALRASLPSPPYPELSQEHVRLFRYMDNLEFFKHIGVYNAEKHYKVFMDKLSVELGSIEFFDGAFEIIRFLKDMGVKTGIVTSETKEEFAIVNSIINIKDLFEHIICLDDVINPKPSGEPLLLVLERIGVTRDEAVYVGDSINDLMCARDAGVDFYLAAWGLNNEDTAALCEKGRVLMQPFDLINAINLDNNFDVLKINK